MIFPELGAAKEFKKLYIPSFGYVERAEALKDIAIRARRDIQG